MNANEMSARGKCVWNSSPCLGATRCISDRLNTQIASIWRWLIPAIHIIFYFIFIFFFFSLIEKLFFFLSFFLLLFPLLIFIFIILFFSFRRRGLLCFQCKFITHPVSFIRAAITINYVLEIFRVWQKFYGFKKLVWCVHILACIYACKIYAQIHTHKYTSICYLVLKCVPYVGASDVSKRAVV